MEAWKDIPGHGCYQASDQGQIRRESGKILKPQKAGAGYLKVRIQGKQPYVHTLVALAWIGEIPDNWELNHLNFIRHDNRPSNLEICTRADNMRHQAAPVWYSTQTAIPGFKESDR